MFSYYYLYEGRFFGVLLYLIKLYVHVSYVNVQNTLVKFIFKAQITNTHHLKMRPTHESCYIQNFLFSSMKLLSYEPTRV